MAKLSIPKIKNLEFDQKLVCITAYSARIAQLIDDIADIILVGDSLGMTLHGLESTVGVTINMMIDAGRAVARGSKNSIIVVDMPYGTYEADPVIAYKNASRLLQKTGAHAVKLEGGALMAPTIKFLTERNIPVMGHIGLIPQSVNSLGGYRARGKNEVETEHLIKDIQAITQSGCFSMVLEGVVKNVADQMLEFATVPVIGIGASEKCHGQVLVSDDLLGITEKTAKFVREYIDGKTIMHTAFSDFANDVRAENFPSQNELYR